MFYRIAYERVETFAGEVCDHLTTRCVKSDQVDGQPKHATDTDTASNTSLAEQQTVVVSERHESFEEMASLKTQRCKQVSGVEAEDLGEDKLFLASSGKKADTQGSEFPERMRAVAQALALPPEATFPSRAQNSHRSGS